MDGPTTRCTRFGLRGRSTSASAMRVSASVIATLPSHHRPRILAPTASQSTAGVQWLQRMRTQALA